MKISRGDLSWAVSQGVITAEQAEALWRALAGRNAAAPQFDLAHLAYYFGALIVISAMGWFMTLAFLVFGALGVFGYLAHLAYRVFRDSLLFPFALTILGIAIIYLGVTYHRHRERIERAVWRLVPPELQARLPRPALRG